MSKSLASKNVPSPAEALELESFLPYRLSVLSNTLSQTMARIYQQRFNLSITEWRVIAVLGRSSGLSASEVAERTAMDKVTVSRAVGRLLTARRLKRRTARGDRRRSVLELSAQGRRVYEEIAPLALGHERSLLAFLGTEERTALNRILEKLASGLRTLREQEA